MRKVPPKRCIPRSLAFDGSRDGCVHRTYVAFLGEGSTSLYFPGEEALEKGGEGTCVCVFRSLDRPFPKKNGYGVTVAEPTRPWGAFHPTCR